MATIRKPTQSEFHQAPAAKAARKVASEAGDIGSALGGGISDTLVMIILFPALFLGLWHGPFILLGGDVIAGVLHLAIGGGALYVLNKRFKRKRDAGRAKQLGREMAAETAPSATGDPAAQRSEKIGVAPVREKVLAPSQIHFSRQALVSKLIPIGVAAFVFGALSFAEFGFMFVLCLFFAFRAVVLVLNIMSPSVCLKLSESGVETADLVGFSAEMHWHNVALISPAKASVLKQHLSFRYGSRHFVELLGFDTNGAERTLRIPYKMLSLEIADVEALIEKAQNNELAGKAPARTIQRPNSTAPATPSASHMRSSDTPDLRVRAQTGFGKRGL